ncbi:MAG: formate/nitrite transporter family protein [Nitrospirota bacterium]
MEKEEKKTLPQKSYHTILRQEINAGLLELNRPVGGLFLSSLSAGLDIGFSLLLMATMLSATSGIFSPPVVHILVSVMYSVGFILVILGRSELFTEHTALAVLPVLDRKASLADLFRIWAVVFTGNITGAIVFSCIISWMGPELGIINLWAFAEIAHSLLDHAWWVIFVSAVIAGWLMGELAWLLAAGRDTISQVLFVFVVTTAIGFLNLHHSIAGTVEVVTGILTSSELHLKDFLRFSFLSTTGNAFGGVIFVAIIKYGHAMQTIEKY